MKFKISVVATFIVLFFSYCSGPNSETVSATAIKTYDQIEKLNWLNGVWERTSAVDVSTETWEKKNDSTLYGVGLTLEGNDTVFFEIMTIEQKGDKLYYIPVVKDQNGSKPVEFLMTSAKKEWIFENPKHDFPTKIVYKKIKDDSLYAEISAIKDGKEVKVPFPFKRKK